VTWTVDILNLNGSTRVTDLPWSSLSFTHVLNAPGAVEIGVSIDKVSRADIEPGQSDYRISQDGTIRAEGRLWNARVDTALADGSYRASLTGEGIAGILARRLIDWESRYEPITESPTNINTLYAISQEDILWDLVERTQAEAGGDLGITQGAHTGGTHDRRRWYCAEDGVFLADVFDDFASLSDGIDWAISPTLTDSGSRELVTFNPHRGTDLSGSVVLDGAVYLDTLSYEIDAGQIVTRGRSVAEGDCDPPVGDVTDAGALADYGLLEDFEGANSDQVDDAGELAAMLVSPHPVVGMDVTYELTDGPAIGDFDVGDRIRVISATRPGWPLDITAHVQEIEVTVQLPDTSDETTFVRVNVSEWFEESS
jgi:hypothetical protein